MAASSANPIRVRGDALQIALAQRGWPPRRALGATRVLDRMGSNQLGEREAYDVIIDVVAGADMPSFFDMLNPNGRLVVVGAVGGQPPPDFGSKLMAAFSGR